MTTIVSIVSIFEIVDNNLCTKFMSAGYYSSLSNREQKETSLFYITQKTDQR